MKKFVVAGLLGLVTLAGLGSSVNAMPLSGLVARTTQTDAASKGDLPVVKVQSPDIARIGQLEEQIRSLNGRIEEMSFQLLQMQEQIRKFQEDNEFRFQDLESGRSSSKKSGALATPKSNDQASVTPGVTDSPSPSAPAAGGADMAGVDPNATGAAPAPSTLGQIIFDENGNPVSARTGVEPGANATLPGVDTGLATEGGGLNDNPGSTTEGGQATASLGDPGDLYQSAYGHVLSGDYGIAEQEFRNYLEAFPSGDKAADASFWMGEAQYSQGKYSDAAKTFLNAHQSHGKSPKAPEMLLKLGMSLGALDNKETACATLREVGKRYPKASPAVKAKVTSEQSRFGC
ncbi:tol-pal system protein YbgF [Sinorhizobium medicae]|jgi:tol-pal system protein YbgF|uniref:Cell division coordinator CpoB n=3 Tax=Sinorhizobium medicae TaxID=110321 RepID=A6UCS5_SINMW|nr:tol-pal system protein YbgF [Sinorhizobium medicae]ABR61455.1 Tol-Pal system YbgF [Sinorhizobium medicae WSM419]MBO1943063.1 tol-pal system protein YbgF [Sinorhizobium medicae]MBO1959615.1 tol-pal system protein YbgF [Sinorhizobium medicae]MDX0405180.1 tol-pal system protein YbgF [Sinorhizobium medicae]MDX0410835.1 tol-pal system protein YbgF [Sinorhizobium medicae]